MPPSRVRFWSIPLLPKTGRTGDQAIGICNTGYNHPGFFEFGFSVPNTFWLKDYIKNCAHWAPVGNHGTMHFNTFYSLRHCKHSIIQFILKSAVLGKRLANNRHLQFPLLFPLMQAQPKNRQNERFAWQNSWTISSAFAILKWLVFLVLQCHQKQYLFSQCYISSIEWIGSIKYHFSKELLRLDITQHIKYYVVFLQNYY